MADLAQSLRLAAEAYRDQARDATADLLLEAADTIEAQTKKIDAMIAIWSRIREHVRRINIALGPEVKPDA